MTWPQLPAFNAANFLDHFDSLDTAKWTSVTSGTGAVSVTDSYLKCDAPANSAAFVYRPTKIDKTKSQLWLACIAQQASGNPQGPMHFAFLNGASAPAADTDTNIVAKTLVRVNSGDGEFDGMEYDYWSSGGTRTYWNGATNVWATGFAYAIPEPVRHDDYYITGLEMDAPNLRWRLFGMAQSFSTPGTYEFDQGWRLFAFTDWITWANTRSNADVWLVLGNPYNNNVANMETRVEWVRYAEALPGNSVMDAWVASKGPATTPEHQIRHLYSYDGLCFVPQDRTTWALAFGGSYDSNDLQNPRVVWDGETTDYLFYTATGSSVKSIAVASATHKTPQDNTWTKYGSNPILSLGGGGADDEAFMLLGDVVCDKLDPNSGRRWKMIYAGGKVSDSKTRILYATAPAATGPWTKRGTIINVGGGGAKDEVECTFPVLIWHRERWEVWYEARDTGNLEYLLRATGTDLASLTKDSTDYTATVVSANQALTANLDTAPGRSVTVASTSGYVKDAAVAVSQSSSGDVYGYSKIRKIVSGTVLELYHGLTGFTTTYPAKIKQFTASRNRSPRVVVKVGSEWWFYVTFWEPFFYTADDPNYAPILEEMHLYTHSAEDPSGATATIQYQP